SEVLRDALTELDSTSDKITFNFSPQAPHLRISTFGMSGSTEVNFSRDSDVIESFHAAATEHFSYRHSQVQHSLNALAFSTKTSIRINEMGSLSMQFMIQADRGDACFVELLCLPLVPIE
ncbi:checkpoint clamp complex protein Rad1, partial [Tieghemiomyces parasiticus]